MDNITSGHWIFAGVFMVAFLGFLVWSYRKDLPTLKLHYPRVMYFITALIVVFFLLFIFRRII